MSPDSARADCLSGLTRGRRSPCVMSMVAAGLSTLAFQLLLGFPGSLTCESYCFMDHYLSSRPLPAILFDSRATEFGLYQGRELSNLFDWIDVQFIHLCVSWQMPHFLSLTYLAFIVAIAVLAWRFFIDDLALAKVVAAGLLGLYATSPTVAIWNSFGRSAKIGVTLCLAIAIPMLYRLGTWPGWPVRARRGQLLVLSGIFMAMTMFDRQGAFLLGMIAAYLTAALALRRTKLDVLLLSVALSAELFSVLYTYIVAPWLTYQINGYWPDMQYLRVDFGNFMQQPMHYLSHGAELLADTCRFMYGNLSGAMVLVGMVLLLALPVRWSARAIMLSMLLLLVLMNAIMVMRHPPLLEPDMRRIYYWNPQTVILLLVVPLIVSQCEFGKRWGRLFPLLRRCLPPLLLTMFLGNLSALPLHIDRAYSRYLNNRATLSQETLAALREPHKAHSPKIAELNWLTWGIAAK